MQCPCCRKSFLTAAAFKVHVCNNGTGKCGLCTKYANNSKSPADKRHSKHTAQHAFAVRQALAQMQQAPMPAPAPTPVPAPAPVSVPVPAPVAAAAAPVQPQQPQQPIAAPSVSAPTPPPTAQSQEAVDAGTRSGEAGRYCVYVMWMPQARAEVGCLTKIGYAGARYGSPVHPVQARLAEMRTGNPLLHICHWEEFDTSDVALQVELDMHELYRLHRYHVPFCKEWFVVDATAVAVDLAAMARDMRKVAAAVREVVDHALHERTTPGSGDTPPATATTTVPPLLLHRVKTEERIDGDSDSDTDSDTPTPTDIADLREWADSEIVQLRDRSPSPTNGDAAAAAVVRELVDTTAATIRRLYGMPQDVSVREWGDGATDDLRNRHATHQGVSILEWGDGAIDALRNWHANHPQEEDDADRANTSDDDVD